MGVIGQDDVGKYPDKVADPRVLTDMDVAVKAHVVADLAGALNVAQRPDLKIESSEIPLFTVTR